MKKIILCVLASIHVCILPEAFAINENAFYAISSLRYHLDTLTTKDAGSIKFDVQDVQALWERVCQADDSGILNAARTLYDGAVQHLSRHSSKVALNQARELLEIEWQRNMSMDYSTVDYTRFLIEDAHPAKAKLEEIFSLYDPLQSLSALKQAGFRFVSERPSSMCVLAHEQLPGYLLKLYPLNEKNNYARDMTWAVKRCLGAENIRNLIANKGLKYFSVPMKWLFFVPQKDELESRGIKNYVVLLVEDMQLVSKQESRFMWLHASREVVKEIYAILSQGYSSCFLPGNVPYTKSGKFSCIDTENPQRRLPFHHVKKHLSPKMQDYWDKLVRQGGDTVGFWVTQP